jgi:hypothetical protein
MLQKFSKIAGEKNFDKFEKKGELYGLEASCREGYQVVYQDVKGILFNLKGFCLTEKATGGKTFKDGSKLLIKGWMNVIQVADCYQLFPIQSSFGFCFGSNGASLDIHRKLCDEQKLNFHDEIEVSYIVDDVENIIYEVKKYIFQGNPLEFDIFNGKKPIVLFKNQQEFGFLKNGQFVFHDRRSATIVHPLASWWMNQQ